MTLGPALVALALFEKLPRVVAVPLATFGRVPLFTYLLQVPLIHAIAVGLALATYGRADWLFGLLPPEAPEDYGYGLPILYLVWVGCMLILYLPCRWFADLKRRRPGGVLSYL
jgi:hypothetical protein